MDTSETYIKMCDCFEVQKNRRDEKNAMEGDWYAYRYYNKYENIGTIGWDLEHRYIGHPIWLPRQDQIQEMLGCEDIQVALHRLYQIADFWIGRDLKSLEQLWLAFYMHENHKLIWDGEKWQKR